MLENIVVFKDSHEQVATHRRVIYYLKNNTLRLRTSEKLLSKFNEELQADRMYASLQLDLCRSVSSNSTVKSSSLEKNRAATPRRLCNWV